MNGVCSRCGATQADGRAVLRAGASAYASAHADAMAMRWGAARKNLNLAASLGIGGSPEWQALHRLINAADPAVTARAERAYQAARSEALRGNYDRVDLFTVPDVPTGAYLSALCRQGVRLRARQRGRTWRNMAAVGSVSALVAVGTTVSLRPPRRSTGEFKGVSIERTLSVSPSSSPQPVVTVPPVTDVPAATLPPYPYPARLARRYYNDARELRRQGSYREAARVADLAIAHSKTVYLLPHALLLRAELANIIQEPDAPRLWARIAQDAPDSSYAPMGLLRAARSAKQMSKDTQAAQGYVRELIRRYPGSKEANQVRDSFSPRSHRATKDNAQRQ